MGGWVVGGLLAHSRMRIGGAAGGRVCVRTSGIGACVRARRYLRDWAAEAPGVERPPITVETVPINQARVRNFDIRECIFVFVLAFVHVAPLTRPLRGQPFRAGYDVVLPLSLFKCREPEYEHLSRFANHTIPPPGVCARLALLAAPAVCVVCADARARVCV